MSLRKFKIHRGTLQAIENNIASIGENDIVITTDKNIPTPTNNDNNKVLQVSNGEYDLGNPNLDNFAQGTNNKFLNATELNNVQQIPNMAQAILGKQPLIDNNNKLNADLVDDSNSTNKFTTNAEKQTWNNKSVVSVSPSGTSADEVQYITINGVEKKLAGGGGSSGVEIDDTTTSTTKVWSSNKVNSELGNKQNTINSSNKVNADYIDDSNSTNKFATIPIITFTNNEVITPYTYVNGKAYLTFNVSNDIKAILKRTYQSTIKVDLSAITNIPVPYVWIKKNVSQTMQSIDLLQYSFDNAGFDFGHAQDQTNPYIKMIKIGNGGAIYVESLNRLYIAFTNISDDALWQGINSKASINDTTPSSTTTYSSNKINTELGNKSSVIFVDWS